MNFKKFSDKTTIYQYKLMKRISHWNLFTGFYAFLYVLFAVVCIHQFGFYGMITIVAGYVLLQMLHSFIIWAVDIVQPHTLQREWAFQFCFPWIGLLPASFTSFPSLKRTHWHMLIVGFITIGCFYPWFPVEVTATLCFLHVWMLMPRFAIFWMLRKQKGYGLIKFDTKETSFYKV